MSNVSKTPNFFIIFFGEYKAG